MLKAYGRFGQGGSRHDADGQTAGNHVADGVDGAALQGIGQALDFFAWKPIRNSLPTLGRAYSCLRTAATLVLRSKAEA